MAAMFMSEPDHDLFVLQQEALSCLLPNSRQFQSSPFKIFATAVTGNVFTLRRLTKTKSCELRQKLEGIMIEPEMNYGTGCN